MTLDFMVEGIKMNGRYLNGVEGSLLDKLNGVSLLQRLSVRVSLRDELRRSTFRDELRRVSRDELHRRAERSLETSFFLHGLQDVFFCVEEMKIFLIGDLMAVFYV